MSRAQRSLYHLRHVRISFANVGTVAEGLVGRRPRILGLRVFRFAPVCILALATPGALVAIAGGLAAPTMVPSTAPAIRMRGACVGVVSTTTGGIVGRVCVATLGSFAPGVMTLSLRRCVFVCHRARLAVRGLRPACFQSLFHETNLAEQLLCCIELPQFC
jgi:hypothetical protein